jgi:hypothetical protein
MTNKKQQIRIQLENKGILRELYIQLSDALIFLERNKLKQEPILKRIVDRFSQVLIEEVININEQLKGGSKMETKTIRDEVLRALEDKSSINKIHSKLLEGVTFTIKDYYLGKNPSVISPYLHAVVDMYCSMLVGSFCRVVVEETLDVLEKRCLLKNC